VSDAQGHPPGAAVAAGVDVHMELTTPSVGGLSINDFIVAARVNQLKLEELQPKRKARYWA